MRRGSERTLASVPRTLWLVLAAGLLIQLAVGAAQPAVRATADALPRAPSEAALRLATLGEPVAAAKIMMLWLQAFDFQSGTRIPYRELDYEVLGVWLERIIALDPIGQYPLMAAARLYAEVADPSKQRMMIELVFREYLKDPNRRWPWAAHAAVIAKHQLHDDDLANQIARALQHHTTTPNAPAWVRTMGEFISADLDELEATRILIGGLLASGQSLSERERKLLEERLRVIEQRVQAAKQNGSR